MPNNDDEFLKAVLKKVRLFGRHTLRCKRMSYETIPWSNPYQFNGVAIQDYLRVPVEGNGREVEAIFDMWLAAQGEEYAQSLTDMGFKEIDQLLTTHAKTVGEKAVLLLWLCAGAKGATVTYSDTEIEVTHDGVSYGVRDGVVFSRFGTGVKLDGVKPREVLDGTHLVRTYDLTFIALYREANRVGKDVLAALTAIKMKRPDLKFAQEMGKAKARDLPSSEVLSKVEAALMDMSLKDPLSRAYSYLVPKWMAASEFYAIGRIHTRQLDPPHDIRYGYVQRLHNFFHKQEAAQ